MATYAEVKGQWVDYVGELKSDNDTLRAALAEAQATAQANATALQEFQDNDAATDAQQLADAQQALADDLQSTLDNLKNPPAEPPVELPENPPADPDAPVEGTE